MTAGLLADEEVAGAASLIVIGDRRVLALGECHANVQLNLPVVKSEDEALAAEGTVFWDLAHLDPADVTLGEISLAGGQSALTNFNTAVELGRKVHVGAVCFTPFNKAAMRLAHPSYEDEIVYMSELLSFDGKASEFNILDGLWNARVTSHVPLSEVAGLITEDIILENIEL
ncbi:MAG: 4-hydroxythreonine-4-phosphate dehydrogenase PdxA, partial [Pseudomonadota bacterium]